MEDRNVRCRRIGGSYRLHGPFSTKGLKPIYRKKPSRLQPVESQLSASHAWYSKERRTNSIKQGENQAEKGTSLALVPLRHAEVAHDSCFCLGVSLLPHNQAPTWTPKNPHGIGSSIGWWLYDLPPFSSAASRWNLGA